MIPPDQGEPRVAQTGIRVVRICATFPALLLGAAAATLIACHDATTIPPEPAALRAVDGATFPVLNAGDSVILEGSGFGTVQGSGEVSFSTQSGTGPGQVLSWSDNQVIAIVPEGVAPGTVTVTPDGGTAIGAVAMSVRSPASLSVDSFKWTEGPALPTAVAGIQLVAFSYPAVGGGFSARVHATGGIGADGVHTTSLFGFVTSGQTFTDWVPGVDSAPASVLYPAAAAATQARARLRRSSSQDSTVEGVSYLIGGMDAAGRVVADVQGMSVWENGDQGAWTRLAGLPDPRAGASASVAYGNLYVVGGFGPDSLALPSVSVAVIDSFGAPTGWLAGPPLPEPLAFTTLVVHNHMIYVLGGETGHVLPGLSFPDTTQLRPDVFAAHLSVRTGFFEASGWQALPTPLSVPRSRHIAADLDAGILVATGVTPPGGAESEFAAFLPDGTLGPFTAISASSIASISGASISQAGSAVYLDSAGAPHVVLAGGITPAGALSGRVWWH